MEESERGTETESESGNRRKSGRKRKRGGVVGWEPREERERERITQYIRESPLFSSRLSLLHLTA